MGWTRRGVLGGLATAPALPLRAQPARAGDIAILRRAYGLLHPGLLRYTTAADVERRFDALERSFSDAPDLAGRYLALSRMLATIRCGHSYANFFNQSDGVKAALFAGRDKLPLRFRWVGDAMVVTADPWRTGIARGSRVVSLNGRPAHEVLAGLMTVARADGANDGKRRSLMSVEGGDDIESFDVFHPLLFGRTDRFDLVVEAPDGRRRNARLDAIDLATRRASLTTDDDSKGWRFERVGETAIMTMPGWAFYDDRFDWNGWLDARFSEMATAGVTGLVIDLRGNEGGRDCGNAIIARLIDAPLAGEGSRRLVRFREVPDDLLPLLDTWDPSFRRLGIDAQRFDDRFYELPQPNDGSGADAVITPKGPRFRGRVAVLIDASNSSATFGFAQRVRAARLATLVGEETGGNRRGINGGAFFFLRLPDSGLEADLPLIGSFPRQPAPDAGIRPDIAPPTTVESIRAGGDPAMARALSVVRGEV